jgi:hypothetical protein
MSKSLIICPVGNPLPFDDRFDKKNHWRYCNDNRLYETMVFAYSNFLPEPNTCDIMVVDKGFKWSLSKRYMSYIDYEKYEYVGFLDDDLVTDIHNVNLALTIAEQSKLKIFQISVTQDSDEFFAILRNKPGIKYTKTNFVETMGMFIHSSLIPIVLEFWNKYDIYCGWGFDKVLCDITKTDGAVIHSAQMHHPKKELSTYDKTEAFKEMDKVLYEITPQFMKDKYNEEWTFVDRQYEKEIVMEIK